MAWKGRRSGGVSPTRALLALSLGVLGYHAAAYASPATWFPIQVPVDRFWLVLLLICVGLSVSAWLDRLQAADAQNAARRDERKNP